MPGKDGKHIFGVVRVGEKGQIVIPKEARKIFGINPGDKLMILGDESQGIAIVKADTLWGSMMELFNAKEISEEDADESDKR